MDIQERFSVILKVSKVVKWSCIFVRSIRGLPNFLMIPIMNPLTRVHDTRIYTYAYMYIYNYSSYWILNHSDCIYTA